MTDAEDANFKEVGADPITALAFHAWHKHLEAGTGIIRW